MIDYVARAAALAPRIAQAADEIERERRLPAYLLAALHDAGLFRLLLPRSLGGAEINPPTFAQVIKTVAIADGSTAWCLCQNTVCSIVAAWMPLESARAVFTAPNAVLAWGPGPARAQATPGGYRVTGRWSFASGGRHATWLGAHCPVFDADGTQRLDAAGAPIELTVLFPSSEAPMTDIWQVVGLRGTASDAYAVEDLFVPEAFTLIRDIPETRREAGPLYAMSTHLLFACGFACVALGLARSLLDALIALASEKTPRGYRTKLGESALVQAEIATAEARWRGAHMYLMGTLTEVWQSIERTNRLNLDHRMALRLAATHCIHEAVAVADAAYHGAGATAIFERNPFERRFRDIHSVAQQVQARRAHFESVGRHLLGFATDMRFV
jgi:alkylation response protein AidB-like acyl-CoA dehydrogenase